MGKTLITEAQAERLETIAMHIEQGMATPVDAAFLRSFGTTYAGPEHMELAKDVHSCQKRLSEIASTISSVRSAGKYLTHKEYHAIMVERAELRKKVRQAEDRIRALKLASLY